MNNYAQLMHKHNYYIAQAQKARDTHLRQFYYNVAQGYKMRARSLTFEQAAAPAKIAGVQP